MIDIALVLIVIIVLFTVFIFLRSLFSLKICALCGAVSFSWITLLIMFYTGYSVDTVLMALLIGGSIVGSMYLLEEKLPERYQLFKLPYFLTGVYIGYVLLKESLDVQAVYIILALWGFTIFLYTTKNNNKIRSITRKIIKCCKNW